jgi:hypothetical protein
MSDYLWDKSGEPDAEVERLEEMLGRLRRAPRPFEFPPDVKAGGRVESDAHARHNSQAGPFGRAALFGGASSSGRARLAAAAALLLAVLAGALVLLRGPAGEGARASADNEKQIAAPPVTVIPTPASADSRGESLPHDELTASQTSTKTPERETSPRQETSPRVVLAKSSRGAASEPQARARFEGGRETRAEPAGAREVAGAAGLEDGLRAKEQIVYAMRLTSEAMREVRSRASADGLR